MNGDKGRWGRRARMAGVLAMTLTGAAALRAEELAAPEPPEPPTPPPPPTQAGEPLEPEVTIRRRGRDTVYEYRRNGELFMVRVQPSFGPPYHFVDLDGDGELDFRPGDPVRNDIHQWILWRW